MADRSILMSAPMVRAIQREIDMPGTGKTQTRRVINPQPIGTPWYSSAEDGDENPGWRDGYDVGRAPCGAPKREVVTPLKGLRYSIGDRLWVREAWRVSNRWNATPPRDIPPRTVTVFFEAGGSLANQDNRRDWRPVSWPETPALRPDWVGKARPGMFMPRWASRLTLIVTDVRVQRLQDISEADAIAEGIQPFGSWFHVEKANGLSAMGTSARAAYALLWNSINGDGAWDQNPWVAAYTFRPERWNIDAEAAHA